MMTVSSTRYLSKANWSWLKTPSFFGRTTVPFCGSSSPVTRFLGLDSRRGPAHQAHRQPHPKNHIEGQTETGPPKRYSRVFNKPVMDEIKNSVANNRSNGEPKAPLETEYRKAEKSSRDDDFNQERLRRTSHHSKQYII